MTDQKKTEAELQADALDAVARYGWRYQPTYDRAQQKAAIEAYFAAKDAEIEKLKAVLLSRGVQKLDLYLGEETPEQKFERLERENAELKAKLNHESRVSDTRARERDIAERERDELKARNNQLDRHNMKLFSMVDSAKAEVRALRKRIEGAEKVFVAYYGDETGKEWPVYASDTTDLPKHTGFVRAVQVYAVPVEEKEQK